MGLLSRKLEGLRARVIPFLTDWRRVGKYYSQFDQDRWVIREVFRGKRNGYFVEAAAAGGVITSNTYILEKYFGWNGICVEANDEFFAELVQNRGCVRERCCLADGPGSAWFFKQGYTSGIVGLHPEGPTREQLIDGGLKLIEVPTIALADLLDKHSAPKVIDYLSLDIEGSEELVLRNFPFDRYVFLAVTIERPNGAVKALLEQNGYVFQRESGVDSCYLHRSFLRGGGPMG